MAEWGRSYTRGERRARGWLVLRGAKQALADCVDDRLDRHIDRIDARAEERWDREAHAAHSQLESAKNAVAAAKVAKRAAKNGDRNQAAKQLRDAEATLRRAASAAAKYDIR